jgi:hypothetical protein
MAFQLCGPAHLNLSLPLDWPIWVDLALLILISFGAVVLEHRVSSQSDKALSFEPSWMRAVLDDYSDFVIAQVSTLPVFYRTDDEAANTISLGLGSSA